MDTNDIQRRLDALIPVMIGKGFRNPSSTMHINSQAEFSVGGSWKDDTTSYGEAYHYVRASCAEDAIAAFEAWLAAQPDGEQRKLNEFMAAVGKAADLGRELGINADFVNPLTVMMKTLSENALVHRVAAE